MSDISKITLPDNSVYNLKDSTARNSINKKILTPADPISIPPTNNPTKTYSMSGLTSNHIVIAWNFSDSPENQPPCNLQITTSANSFTITNNGGTTDQNCKPIFAIPTQVAATEQS